MSRTLQKIATSLTQVSPTISRRSRSRRGARGRRLTAPTTHAHYLGESAAEHERISRGPEDGIPIVIDPHAPADRCRRTESMRRGRRRAQPRGRNRGKVRSRRRVPQPRHEIEARSARSRHRVLRHEAASRHRC